MCFGLNTLPYWCELRVGSIGCNDLGIGEAPRSLSRRGSSLSLATPADGCTNRSAYDHAQQPDSKFYVGIRDTHVIPMTECLVAVLVSHAQSLNSRFATGVPEHYLFRSGRAVRRIRLAEREAAGPGCRLHDTSPRCDHESR
jgi:hypothetical protein